ncbi:5-methyltetrahydropteroyltriglutamate--homocysteine S-methyltransferase [Derxia gummosa]|uniref:5-methyltetrahydropteroyltriglutamate--homocysteine methyltransferase n=1 Tax=Derxia gummosa DSM 723 TaxID=1121388 RepID=A0A8B6X1P0_9BURK|nr:5-methyltetrahydropteroyltriglutamate--homocysteine S-methyltransferase [Derxia gummosa]
MTLVHTLGFPRIGERRELKFALESFWRGDSSAAQLEEAARFVRARRWQTQARAGLGLVTVGDFALYDHVLDASLLLGAVPARFGFGGDAGTAGHGAGADNAPATGAQAVVDRAPLGLAGHFALARGNAAQPALEMTKWFDTNYHYLVPELDSRTRLSLHAAALLDEVREAQAFGHRVKVALVGPLTWLRLAKSHEAGFDRRALAADLAECYATLFGRLGGLGVEWVQLDETALVTDLDDDWLHAADLIYARFNRAEGRPRLLLATAFGDVSRHADRLAGWPIDGLHLDLVRAPDQLAAFLPDWPEGRVLSAGVVDGRNIWRNDLRLSLATLAPLHAALGDRLWLAPSCSLLHVPVTLDGEDKLDAEVKPWLAFATEKLGELALLARALDAGDNADAPAHEATAIARALAASDAARGARLASRRTRHRTVRARVEAITPDMAERFSPHAGRAVAQQAALGLPPLPTTTIGSFPQTPAIRAARAAHKRGELGALDYLNAMRAEVAEVIRRQEALGLDVLVHGEPERTDMVEYFAEKLWGYAVTANGWVQSYGSRCVKPPILFGDVLRPEAMTVDTAVHAQSLTGKPVKGMLTGPVTMLQWSFVRDDLPREQVQLQLALALRDEVQALEAAGIRIIQIDEPAFREGLPLRAADQGAWLDAAVRAFRLSAAGVADTTQIHTHMCYSEFNDVLPWIAAMDADVITIETSRSAMELLDGFAAFDYPNQIGPGVYDIHSPRVPSVEAMLALLERACSVIPRERLWVNPDCGLKTRGWAETEAALANMVAAARRLRASAPAAAAVLA